MYHFPTPETNQTTRACILHHLNTTTRGYPNCPLCEESVDARELKSVVLVPKDHPTTGSTMTFELLGRTPASLLVAPISVLPKQREIGPADIPSIKVGSTLRRGGGMGQGEGGFVEVDGWVSLDTLRSQIKHAIMHTQMCTSLCLTLTHSRARAS